METKEDDYIEHLRICSTHDFLLFFTNYGKVYRLKVYELPEGARTAKGRALVNLLPLREGESVRSVIPTRDFSETKYVVFGTRNGLIKKTELHGLQHADPRGRHHRDQAARRGRARLRARHGRRGRHHHGVPVGLRRALQRVARAADGPRHLRRARDERLREGQPRARDGRRARRHRAVRRDGERFRQAHPDRGLPGQGPRHQGREDDPAHRSQGRRWPARWWCASTRSCCSSPRAGWCSARACAASHAWVARPRA